VSCAIVGIVHSALVQRANSAACTPALRKILMFIEISPRAWAPDSLLPAHKSGPTDEISVQIVLEICKKKRKI
jgi:hypothetical protein